MRKTVLVDIDHTVSAAWPREGLQHGEGGWDDYHAASVNDELIVDIADMLKALWEQNYTIIGFTARPEKWRRITMDWMLKKEVILDDLLMRPDDAFRPAPEIKVELALKYFGSAEQMAQEVAFLIEDREDVCELFHGMGITTLQVKGRQS